MHGKQAQRTDLAGFVRDMVTGAAQSGSQYNLDLAVQGVGADLCLPLRILSCPASLGQTATLVVTFHGAVDQARRGFPVFEGDFIINAIDQTATMVLALADPSLWLSKSLLAAWYQPNEHLDVPSAIATVVAGIYEALAPARLVFVGGSTGGHAALVQSARFEGSVCVAINPITRISAYNPAHIASYLDVCWPGRSSLSDLPSTVVDDCADVYAEGHDNSVIVLQNATDLHVCRQAAPFAARIRTVRQFLFISEFFPTSTGHVYPAQLRAQWVAAAALAPTIACQDIARTRSDTFGSVPLAPPSLPLQDLAPRDLAVAARLAAMATGG
jgi:poly(3-hydroxybutyrate) depolymerase